MKNAAAVFVALAVASSAVAQGSAPFMINTPTPPPIECVPTQITWTSGGAPPFFLIISEPDANGPPTQQYPNLSGNSFTWLTNITAGTSIGFTLRDNNGVSEQTSSVIVQQGTSTSCIGGGAAPPPSSSGSSAPSSSGASVTGPSTTGPSVTPTTPAGSTVSSSHSGSSSSSVSHSGSASGGSPSPSNTPSAAFTNTVGMGALGFVSAVVAAIIA